jgi:hypothetical protein
MNSVLSPFAATFPVQQNREEQRSKFSYIKNEEGVFTVCRGTPLELRNAAKERDRYYREFSKSAPVSGKSSPELDVIIGSSRSSTSPVLLHRTVFSA